MRKVLFVDDSETILHGYLDIAELKGFDAVGAKDGLEALAVLEREDISVVVSDINMPNMDGFELLKRLKDKYPSIPVIIVSSVIYEATASMMGASDYFVKPADFDKLFEKIRDYNGK